MKKQISCLAVITVTVFFIGYINFKNSKQIIEKEETRGIFISYIEYLQYFQEKTSSEIIDKINKMIEITKKNHFNLIYLQVRPFSDSIYQSKVFPFSHTISGIQGKIISLDILDYFIKVAHDNQIKIYAWVNPYRISNNTDISILSEDNPAYKWLNTNHVKVIENKGIFYNPASERVKDLIIAGIKEIVENYQIDGILLDDYFYPEDETIDLENYREIDNNISLADFRLSQVNELMQCIYQTIKRINPNILFGVSPDGNIENNYNMHYADIKRWLKEEGYIDYIMPQLYYGFNHDTKPFIQVLNEWQKLIQNNTQLIVALPIYKAGKIDEYAGKGKDEWLENNNIIQKQIQVSRNIPKYYGFSIFRYDFFENNQSNINLQYEIENYQSIFDKK